MLKRMMLGKCSTLMGLLSLPFAASMTVTPAQAHEWFRLDRTLSYPYGARDPSDPNEGVSASGYRPVTREIESYRPVDPLPWGDVNKRVTPIPKPSPQQQKAQ